MPIKKYRVDTDKGSFIVEVDEPGVSPNDQLERANRQPLKEPTTKTGGYLKGLSDYAGDVGRAAFQSLARPGLRVQSGDSIKGRAEPASKMETIGDLTGLMLPTSLPMKSVPRDMPSLKEPIGNRAARFVARRVADVGDLTPNIVNSKTEERVIGALRQFGKPRPGNMLDRYMPSKSGPVQAGVESELPQHPESLIDRHMPNQPRETQPGVETGDVPQSQESLTQSLVDRFMPNRPADAAAPEVASSSLEETLAGIESPATEAQTLGQPRVKSWKSGFGPSAEDATTLRGKYGSKEAARILNTKPDQIKELAPQMDPAALPSETRARLDAAFDALPTMEEKIKYAMSAPNNLAKAYLAKKLGVQ